MNLTWIPNITSNVVSQRASKRRKSVGGAFDTTGFTPPNDLGTGVAAVTTTVLDNLVYEFKVENICTVNGPTINNNGIREQIKFACIIPTKSATGTTVTVGVPVVGLDITKANFVLKKQSDNSIVGTSGLIPRVGSTITHTFPGLTASTAYYFTVELVAIVNGAEVLSSDLNHLNALCGGNVTAYQISTTAVTVVCDRYMNATAAPITGLSYVPCSGILNSTLSPGGQICIVSGSLVGGGALTLIEANTSSCPPDYNILVENLSTMANVDSLTNASTTFFAPSVGAFPLLPGQSLQGSHGGGGFTGLLRMAVSGTPDVSTVMTLTVAGVFVTSVPIPAAGTYDFPSRYYSPAELMHVTLV